MVPDLVLNAVGVARLPPDDGLALHAQRNSRPVTGFCSENTLEVIQMPAAKFPRLKHWIIDY